MQHCGPSIPPCARHLLTEEPPSPSECRPRGTLFNLSRGLWALANGTAPPYSARCGCSSRSTTARTTRECRRRTSGTGSGTALRAAALRARLRGVALSARRSERGRQRRRHGALPREQPGAPTVRVDRVPLARARPRRFRAAQRQQDGPAHVGKGDARRARATGAGARRRRLARTLQRRRPSSSVQHSPRKCADVIAASASSRTATIASPSSPPSSPESSSVGTSAPRSAGASVSTHTRSVSVPLCSRACANASRARSRMSTREEVGRARRRSSAASSSLASSSLRLISTRWQEERVVAPPRPRAAELTAWATCSNRRCAGRAVRRTPANLRRWPPRRRRRRGPPRRPLPRNRRPWTSRGGATATCGSSSTPRQQNTNHAGLSPACAFRDASIIVQTDEQTLDMFCNWLHHYRQLKLPNPVYAVAARQRRPRSARATLRTSRWRRRGWTGSAARAAVLAASARRTLGRAPSTR